MQGIKLLFWSIWLMGSLTSCGNEVLLPSDYIVWVEDPTNGLNKKKQVPPLEVTALYKPAEYIIANEERTNILSESVYQERSNKLLGMHYLTLKLGIEEEGKSVVDYQIETAQEKEERYNYLSFAMQRDIKLVEGTDTLPCKLYHFERSYDLVSYRTFVLGFEKRKENEDKDKTLILDLAYFNTGPIKLNYKATDINSVPNIKLQ